MSTKSKTCRRVPSSWSWPPSPTAGKACRGRKTLYPKFARCVTCVASFSALLICSWYRLALALTPPLYGRVSCHIFPSLPETRRPTKRCAHQQLQTVLGASRTVIPNVAKNTTKLCCSFKGVSRARRLFVCVATTFCFPTAASRYSLPNGQQQKATVVKDKMAAAQGDILSESLGGLALLTVTGDAPGCLESLLVEVRGATSAA